MKEVKGVEIEAAAKYNEAKRNMGKRWDPGTDKRYRYQRRLWIESVKIDEQREPRHDGKTL
ncbi:hypothetical protein CCACVL1_08571 [Corchorus capsularis]|uniref:Uncharacterized protein n=1 Tax=Corchorus capsularis TaxID=210143 RepID=A0A1R3IZP3_COCAP|nr:hypothetical protein CCACVL1_08571 [Corchorus capsularis]